MYIISLIASQNSNHDMHAGGSVSQGNFVDRPSMLEVDSLLKNEGATIGRGSMGQYVFSYC